MDPASKGWLKEYLNSRSNLFIDLTSEGQVLTIIPLTVHSAHRLDVRPTGGWASRTQESGIRKVK
jgi:hypothetical protein